MRRIVSNNPQPTPSQEDVVTAAISLFMQALPGSATARLVETGEAVRLPVIVLTMNNDGESQTTALQIDESQKVVAGILDSLAAMGSAWARFMIQCNNDYIGDRRARDGTEDDPSPEGGAGID